jgi:hypothetical protein
MKTLIIILIICFTVSTVISYDLVIKDAAHKKTIIELNSKITELNQKLEKCNK